VRYGLLADVHGNLAALEAALRFLERERVDSYLCAGDLVGYGPQPDECVARVSALPGVCVAGNHDLIVIGELSAEGAGDLARDSLTWSRAVASDETLARLRALPRYARADGGVVVTHGALNDPERYVWTPEQAAAELRRAAELEPAADIVVVGHTHQAMAFGVHSGLLLAGKPGRVRLPEGERFLLNPGSTGQSRDRLERVRVAVLDLNAGEANFAMLRYDARSCRAALRARGRPPGSCYLPPRPAWRRAAGSLRRRLRRSKRD
jgi:predicted phosphodiesterase